MKKLSFLTASVLALPLLTSASTFTDEFTGADNTGGDFGQLLTNILEFSNTILIPFVIGIGFLVFVWGMFQYFIAGGANDEKKEAGKSLMIYATLGFVLIIVFWGVINLVAGSTGLDADTKIDSTINNVKI